MVVLYNNGKITKEIDANDLYKDVAGLLAEEEVEDPVTVKVQERDHPENQIQYRISLRSGTKFITELTNTMPEEYLKDSIKPVFLTCVIPEKNAYKFYRLDPITNGVRATYGRMGTQKNQLFGERSFDYPRNMFWPKYFEKISKGYVDRSDLYLDTSAADMKKSTPEEKTLPQGPSQELFELLKNFARNAVEKAEVKVPVTAAIISESKRLLDKMRDSSSVKAFNENLLELVSILQRPVRTGDGMGVRELMAASKSDFRRIIEREDDLICAMEGSIAGRHELSTGDFAHGINIYEATETQKREVMKHLTPALRQKVYKVYRVIPEAQKEHFNRYLKEHNIRKVKQFWHGSRNQNWLSIIMNSLQLNPNAIITGKMFGKGIYFAEDAGKSWNYTSYEGTKWAGGSSKIAFMGLYATAYGKPYDVDCWDCSSNYEALVKSTHTDCLHAHAGSSLLKDEIVFYNEDAVLLNYVVEFV